MTILLIILVVLVLFGGWRFQGAGASDPLFLILVVVLILVLFGGIGFIHPYRW